MFLSLLTLSSWPNRHVCGDKGRTRNPRRPNTPSQLRPLRPHSPECTACKTNKDYLQEGLKTVYTFYTAAGIIFFLMNLVGKGNYGRYWRFILLAGMGAIEMSLVLNAGSVGGRWMERLMPSLVPFEQIAVASVVYLGVGGFAGWAGSFPGGEREAGDFFRAHQAASDPH